MKLSHSRSTEGNVPYDEVTATPTDSAAAAALVARLREQVLQHNRMVESADASSFRAPHRGPLIRLTAKPRTPLRRALGISAFYHDSAAALVIDGRAVAAAQEERFTRTKHDARLPRHAIDYCLREAGVGIGDLDLIAFYEEPFLKLDRMMQRLAHAMPEDPVAWLEAAKRAVWLQASLPRALVYDGPIAFVQHHVAHAASAFYPSPFERAACLVVDGVGEWATTTFASCDEQGIHILEQLDYPDSLGLFYAAVTDHLGFEVNEGEYKVMGLAPYGSPSRIDDLREILREHEDGSVTFTGPHTLFEPHRRAAPAATLLGVPRRSRNGTILDAHRDLAASAQRLTEERLDAFVDRLSDRTSLRQVVLAGGVALNGAATFKAFRRGGFDDVFVQPAAGDAGASLGAALYAFHALGPHSVRQPSASYEPFLGPAFTTEEAVRQLRGEGAQPRILPFDEIRAVTARALEQGKVVGWFQGRMEFGPRALGARSVLASPTSPHMRDLVNQKIKFRERFRPFAPCLPIEEATRFLDLAGEQQQPLRHMLFVVPVRESQREAIPAVVHVDGTTRPQLVDAERSPRLHALLRQFEKRTGVPVLLNTSLNLAGEPIVCTPADAYKTFMYGEMDLLVVEECVVEKRS